MTEGCHWLHLREQEQEQTDKKGYYFTAGNTSTSWELNNGILRAEMITLDDTVNNNIVKHLLDGHSITQMPEVVKLI